ncbi:MAG TPA: hypothetical protein VF306_01825 [Pirellulales bacterium]
MVDCDARLIIEVVDDVDALAKAREQREKSNRNIAWLKAHAHEVYSHHRGKCICIAGEKLFVADTPEAAYALGRTMFPEDDGLFVRYIPIKKVARIYVYRG